MKQDGLFGYCKPKVVALPCDALWSYFGVAYIVVMDSHYPHNEVYIALHSFVFSIHSKIRELCGFGDLFVLGMHTLCKGEVTMLWFGPLGRCVDASNHALFAVYLLCLCSRICTLIYTDFEVVRQALMIYSLSMWL